jgi:hypothetical protein
MEYKGVPVEDLYKLWVEQQEIDRKRAEAGRMWDATYREKHREERNRKAREYYQKRKNKNLEDYISSAHARE